jgi:hypothetical protein
MEYKAVEIAPLLLVSHQHQTTFLSLSLSTLLNSIRSPSYILFSNTNQQNALHHPLHIFHRGCPRLACTSSRSKSQTPTQIGKSAITKTQQTGAGDVLSGAAQGTATLLSGGTNNAVNSAGASVGDISNSAGDLITRQVGVSTIASCYNNSTSIES